MKTTITKTITPAVTEEIEIEIALPFFSKDSGGSGIYFMICPDESIITVINYATGKESLIQRDKNKKPSWLNAAANGIVITHDEFYAQYEKAISFVREPDFIIPSRKEVEQTETSNI